MTDISIIIVSYNTKDYLRGCLRSIENTKGSASYQVIVVDNASTDGSVDMVLHEFPESRIVPNKRNLGFAAATNIGLERATGRYVFLLNSDTLLTEHALDRIVMFMDKWPEAGACGCRLLNADGTPQPSARLMKAYSLPYLAVNALGIQSLIPEGWLSHNRALFLNGEYDALREVDFVSGAALVVRREVLNDVGYLDERFFLYGEEMDWCYRCRKQGHRIFMFPGAEIIHFGGGSAPSQATLELCLCKGRYEFVEKHSGPAKALAYRLLLMFKHAKSVPIAVAAALVKQHRLGSDLVARKLRVLHWLITMKHATAGSLP